jgi:outer membrane protein assembly factor BamD (BamD/ComL family)
MRILVIVVVLFSVLGCSRHRLDSNLNNAYQAYERGECEEVMLYLSKAERYSRSRSYIQPEISLLRGQCLERQALFVDALQTYQFIVARYPTSEYAYRARARLETLRQLGHDSPVEPAKVSAVSP